MNLNNRNIQTVRRAEDEADQRKVQIARKGKCAAVAKVMRSRDKEMKNSRDK